MEQRIDEAVIVDFDCAYCQDSGIQHGYAELDGEKVLVLRPCIYCGIASGRRAAVTSKNKVKYDFEV